MSKLEEVSYEMLHTWVVESCLLTDVSELLLWCGLSCFIEFASSDFGCAWLQDFDQHTQFVTEQMQMSESLD